MTLRPNARRRGSYAAYRRGRSSTSGPSSTQSASAWLGAIPARAFRARAEYRSGVAGICESLGVGSDKGHGPPSTTVTTVIVLLRTTSARHRRSSLPFDLESCQPEFPNGLTAIHRSKIRARRLQSPCFRARTHPIDGERSRGRSWRSRVRFMSVNPVGHSIRAGMAVVPTAANGRAWSRRLSCRRPRRGRRDPQVPVVWVGNWSR